MNNQLLTNFFKSVSKRRRIEIENVDKFTGDSQNDSKLAEQSFHLLNQQVSLSPKRKSRSLTNTPEQIFDCNLQISQQSVEKQIENNASPLAKSLKRKNSESSISLSIEKSFTKTPKRRNVRDKRSDENATSIAKISRLQINEKISSSEVSSSRSKNERSNQLSEIRNSNENVRNNRKRIKDVKLMREVFNQAQHIQQSQSCSQVLHDFIIEFEFHEFYEEFCRNVRCSLKFENANPKLKNILNTISVFLLSVKQKYSLENLKRTSSLEDVNFRSKRRKANVDSSINHENVENDENDENIATDEIIQMINGSTDQIQALDESANHSNISSSNEKMYRIFRNLLDFVINDILIPFLNSINVDTRLNTSYLLGKLINSIDDLDVQLFDRLKSRLLERLIDKNPKVRSITAYLLYRFQDQQLQLTQNDAVQDALCFHLKYDSSSHVRLSCLNVILINRDTLPVILCKTRDICGEVRTRAFIKLARKVDFKQQLNTEQRLSLVRSGLYDRKQSVVKTFKSQVINGWVKSYDDNLIELLEDLKLNESVLPPETNHMNTNFKLIELFISSYFESFSVDQPQLTKLHSIVINFCKNYLNDEFLIKSEHFNNETFFLWSSLIKFFKRQEDNLDELCMNNEIRFRLKRQFSMVLESTCSNILNKSDHSIDNQTDLNNNSPITDRQSTDHQPIDHESVGDNRLAGDDRSMKHSINDENNNQTVNIPVCKKANNTDLHRKKYRTIEFANVDHEDYSLLDLVLPKFSKFIDFVRKFCELSIENVDQTNVKSEFMFKQLILLLENYEVDDNSRRTIVFELIEYLLELGENAIQISSYVECLMDYVQRNMFKKGKEFFIYSIELLERRHQKLEQDEIDRLSEHIVAKDIRELELQNANLTIKMHEFKDKLDEALSKCQYDQAHEYQIQIDQVKQECNRLIKEIQRMKTVLEFKERKQIQSKTGFQIDNYPIEHIKILQIFEIALKSVHRLFHPAELKIDEYILPGILSIDSQVRYSALRALNQACFLNLQVANKFCRLYYEICLKDNVRIQNLALEGLIDSLVEHGGEMLYGDDCDLMQSFEMNSSGELSFFQNLSSIMDANSNDKAHLKEYKEMTSNQFNTTEEMSRNSLNRSRSRTRKSKISIGSDLDDVNISNKSQFIEINSTNQSNAESIEVRENLTKKFIKFLLMFAKHKNEKLSYTGVMGICKLMLLGRIYSPKLLSELILIYFDSSTQQSISQSIGTFLPIYCPGPSSFIELRVELPFHLTGQHCLIEGFMYTLENIYRLTRGQLIASSFGVIHSNYYDCEINVQNVVEFMLNLLEPVNQSKIAIAFCEKIIETLQIEHEDEYQFKEPYMTNYLIRLLNLFNLVESTEEEQDKLYMLVQMIQSEDRFEELKKASNLRIEKFAAKMNKLLASRSNYQER